jgi:uncharacterized protein (DUF488 family)
MDIEAKTIWTIGHSTRDIDHFIEIVQSFNIQQVADVRHFPGSRKYPHFNKADLSEALEKRNIHYEHLESLGGRRTPKADSKNIAWRHPAFRGYADYMETSEFQKGIDRLEQISSERKTAYMCSEAVWWRCHRSLISDLLKVKGWNVQHIMDKGKSTAHPFTSAANIVGGRLTYQNAADGTMPLW